MEVRGVVYGGTETNRETNRPVYSLLVVDARHWTKFNLVTLLNRCYNYHDYNPLIKAQVLFSN